MKVNRTVESMRIIRYDKLVRDRIPDIIRASGKSCTTEVLSDEAYLRMIDAKLDEELAEYHQEQNLEELADLLEVLRAAVIARGYTLDELESIRAQKAAKRGGFAQKDSSERSRRERMMEDVPCLRSR